MVFLLGISGPTNAGKTYFTDKLKAKCNELKISFSTISTDDFYIDRTHQEFSEREKVNYDRPDSISKTDFLNALFHLREGKSVKIPIYDFSQHNRSGKYRTVNPSNLIIIEGIFTFSFSEIVELYDLKIYVDLESDLRLIRRIVRDMDERGRSIDSVISQYLNTIKPTQEEYVKQDRDIADLILRGDADHTKIIDILTIYINKIN